MNSINSVPATVDILQKVHQHILRQLALPPTLASVAAALYLSSRTLQRLLQQQHTQFRTELAHCRHQAALHYLADNELSLQQIAIRLGFAEQSSFQKAFKSWQGCAPGSFRQHQQQGQTQRFSRASGVVTGELWN